MLLNIETGSKDAAGSDRLVRADRIEFLERVNSNQFKVSMAGGVAFVVGVVAAKAIDEAMRNTNSDQKVVDVKDYK